MINLLLTVAGLVVAGLLSPGPNFVLISGRALSSGRGPAIAAALGVSVGSLTHAVFGVAGFGALLQSSSRLFAAAKLLGAAYLLWIGFKSIRGVVRSRTRADDSGQAASGDGLPATAVGARRSLLDGYLTQMSNPKSTLFFLAMFTTVVPPDTGAGTAAAVVATVAVVALCGYLTIAIVLSRPIFQRAYRRVGSVFDAVFGVLMMGLGLRVGLSDR